MQPVSCIKVFERNQGKDQEGVMFVKQIDMKTAFELASRGMKITTMVSVDPGTRYAAERQQDRHSY